MASTRRKMAPRSSPHLPDEIMEEILLRLPARSVVRFRAVCRSWAPLLSSPAFYRDYAAAKADARHTTTKFLFFAPSAASPRAAATAVYSCRAGAQRAADPLFTIDGLRPGFLLVSSRPCHGLTLLADTRSLALWVVNASTGEHRRLPQRRQRGAWSAGLAYDDHAQEHKVVQIFYHDDADALELGCDVYTLGISGTTRRHWRPASGGVPDHLSPAVKCATIFEGTTTKVPPVFANGRLHWQLYPHVFLHDDLLFPGSKYHPGHGVPVLCFSVADESLSVVAGPAVEDILDYCELDDRSPAVPLHLVELQGSLCMVRDLRHHRHGESLLEIWALRDYSASSSVWSLDHRVSLTPQVARDVHSPRFLTVLGCIGAGAAAGKKILIATSEHKVHAYDPATAGDVVVFESSSSTVLTVPEDDDDDDVVVGAQEEAVAGIRIGLYEDSFARVGGESREHKEADSSMTQVLLRLPHKSIGMCTLVCKQWHTLIESESFVTSHMSLANRNRNRNRRGRKIMMVTNKGGGENFLGFTPLDTWRAGDDPLPLRTLVICSKPCHGLNLISTGRGDYMCNPCTGSIRCLGTAGKKSPLLFEQDNGQQTSSIRRRRRHAFTTAGGGGGSSRRSVGMGFDPLAREHVVVEITRCGGGAPAVCMVKTSCVEYWSCAGAPPRPVTDMPPAHVDGVLYWMSEPHADARRERMIVAFDIHTRAFSLLPCLQPPCDDVDAADPFLVELQGVLSLVISNKEENELQIWRRRRMLAGAEHNDGTSWFNAYKICLQNQPPSFSLKENVVVPLEIESGMILLNTGRALGYYDTRTTGGGTLDVLYSLDQQLHLPRHNLAFPILYVDSLVRIQDDELPDHVTQPLRHEGVSGGGELRRRHSSMFRSCEMSGCKSPGAVYAGCCSRRVLCWECSARCEEHTGGFHTTIPCISPREAEGIAEYHKLPLEHPSVPGSEYCYYNSERDEEDDDVGRHVFVSLKDLARGRQPYRFIECGYRTDGKVVRETWVRRYRQEERGFPM